MKKIITRIGTLGLSLIATAALAQGDAVPANAGYRPTTLWEAVLSTIVFSLVGVLVAIVGFKLFDMAIKFDLEKEICEKNNLSAAILAGAVILGTCVIVACVVLS